MTKPSTTITTSAALELAEADLAAMRAERDALKASLDQAIADATSSALAVPFEPMPPHYQETIIRVLNGRLSYDQSLRLRALLNGLTACNAKTDDGKPVYLPHHAVQWLLEQLTFKQAGQ